MINADGLRRAAMAIIVALLVGIGMGLRSDDPSRADPPAAASRARAVGDAARDADAALARLSADLAGAREHARQGTASTVSGEAPEPELTLAADLLGASSGDADAARRALLALAGIAAAVDPGVQVPSLAYGGPELQLIAAQFRAGAAAATTFVERRHATQAVVDDLGAALAALERDEPAAALVSLDLADTPLALLAAWEERPPLLRYWMTVSVDLIGAARDIATATLANDQAALTAAARRYAKAAEAARGADNALAVTLSEEGSRVSAVPLQRLAAAADEVGAARAALAPLLQEVR